MGEQCQLDRIETKVNDMHLTLLGNGRDVTGVVTRLDRLERDGVRRTWWSKTVVGASLTALAGAILAIFKSHA